MEVLSEREQEIALDAATCGMILFITRSLEGMPRQRAVEIVLGVVNRLITDESTAKEMERQMFEVLGKMN